jgi:hypothetical protein
MKEGELKDLQEVIEEIREELEELPGKNLEDIYRHVCGKKIKYEGDSLFTVYTELC